MIARLRLLGLMVRPRAAITMWTFLVIGLARHAGPTISVDLVWATLALAASYAVATSVNDLADVEIDRTNGLRDASRPLATGAASVTDLRWTAASAGAIAVAAAVPLGAPGLAVIGYRSQRTAITLEAEKFEKYLADEGLDGVLKARKTRGEQDKPGNEVYSRCAKSLIAVDGTGKSGFDLPSSYWKFPTTTPARGIPGARQARHWVCT